MNPRHPALPVVVGLLLLLPSCQSPLESRIQGNPGLFAAQDRFTQDLIRNGLIDVGFSTDLVFMALGKPNQKSLAETIEGHAETWTYKNFLYAQGSAMKVGVNNPGTRYQGGRIYSPNTPGGPSIGSTRTGPVQPTVSDIADAPTGTLHVDFVNGKVTSVRLDR